VSGEAVAVNSKSKIRRTCHREPGDRIRDRGITLIEILITIALIGIVVIPILSAVQVSIRGSSAATDAAELETLLVNALDRINRADRGDYQCDLSGPPTAAVVTAGWPAGQLVVGQEHLDTTTGDWVAGACPVSPTTGNPTFQNGLVQRITLTLTHPDRPITRTLQVVKSDV
jgi:prepilin-type N-terminal cleavage/methylation domain-containing protein